MGKFLNGLFVGIGIGLFIAPQAGEATRRMIMERVVALREGIFSEDEQHLSIDAHLPWGVSPFPAQPAQSATESANGPEVQEMGSTPAARSATEFFGEPESQEMGSTPAAQSASEFFSEPEVQGITSMPSEEVLPTLSNQNANVTDDTGKVADTAPTPDSATNPDQQTPTETPRTDPAAITEELPPSSSPASTPGRTTRRKSSTKTSNTSKARGHNRS